MSEMAMGVLLGLAIGSVFGFIFGRWLRWMRRETRYTGGCEVKRNSDPQTYTPYNPQQIGTRNTQEVRR